MERVPDDPPMNFNDIRADYASSLDWHLRLACYTGPLHFGDPNGALVSRRYVQRQARAMLLAAIYRLKPDLTRDYLTDDLFDLLNAEHLACIRWMDEHSDPPVDGTPEEIDAWSGALLADPEVHAANAARNAYADAWRMRHGLKDEWFGSVAYWTAAIADRLKHYGIEAPGPMPLLLPAPDRALDMYGQSRVPRRMEPASPFRSISAAPSPGRRTLWLDDLRHPPIDTDDSYYEDEGDFAEYDTGEDNVDSAVTRIMPELERRLRRVLEAIEEEERRLNGMVPPVKSNTRAFDLAARGLVNRESRQGIAKSTDIDRSTVSKEIAEVESLTGIEIPRNPGGRPPKPRAVTKRVR